MKQRQTLPIDELCVKLKKDITTLLNLAKSGKVPLWISFNGVDRYEAQPDGSINFVESNFKLDVMPAPEVLNTLLKIQNNQSDILSIDERIKQEEIITSIHKQPVFKAMEDPQTVNLDTTPYQILKEDGKNKEILYNAFPALTTSGTPCILKQRIRIIKREWDDSGKELEGNLQFYSNYPIIIQINDLFAYEDDASEYLRVLEKEFCVSREKLQEIFACNAFNTVVTWVRKAGFEFERLDEGDPSSRPMLRYSDIEKVKEYRRLKKNKK